MKFSIEITDPAKLAGITAARAAHNATLPDAFEDGVVEEAETDKDGVVITGPVTERRVVVPKPGTLATDAAYVQHVMDKAAESYAKAAQSPQAQLEAKEIELQAERAARIAAEQQLATAMAT